MLPRPTRLRLRSNSQHTTNSYQPCYPDPVTAALLAPFAVLLPEALLNRYPHALAGRPS